MRALARARGAIVALAVGAAALVGCAGHEDRTRTALDALDRAAPEEAIAALNEQLEVKRAEDLPKLEGDNALLLLDRGTILQSIDKYELSARDLGAADKSIDLLDMSRGTLDDIGKYMFSDDTGPYKAPAYEKLLVNTVNMMNYLARGDVGGAKVEARRLAIMQKFLRDRGEDGVLLGLGSYLAGFAFEKSGEAAEALAYYDEALKHAQYPSLRDPIRVLTQGAPKSPGQQALVGDLGPLEPPGAVGQGEVLVVVGFGRVPQKEPRRIPIGLALTLTAGALSPGNAAQANALAAKGLVTWVNYPTLGPSRGSYSIPSLAVDGRGVGMEQALDVESEVRKSWQKQEGTIIAAAITRTVTRIVAGEVAQAATTAAAGKNGGVIGLLVGLATSATLTAVDTPDTRCWSTLPSKIAIARLRLPAGRHELRVVARGRERGYSVDLQAGGFAFLPMMALR
jgi:tetratricopeptide (TPR) repeat protein